MAAAVAVLPMVEAAVFIAVAEAVFTAEAEAVFTVEAEASMVAAEFMAAEFTAVVIEVFVAAASMAARGLLAEGVAPKAASWEPAAVEPRRQIGHREIGRRQIGRRMFVPQSTMASGIRSGTRVAPRAPAQGAIPAARRTQASLLVTPGVPMASGTLLARQAALRHEEEACPISADPSARRPASVEAAMPGEADGAVVGVGEVVGVGDVVGVGASPSDGRTGAAIGARTGRLVGIPGGMDLIHMARGRPTLTIRITATTGPTIRRRTDWIHPRIRPTTATRRQA